MFFASPGPLGGPLEDLVDRLGALVDRLEAIFLRESPLLGLISCSNMLRNGHLNTCLRHEIAMSRAVTFI